MMLCNLKYNPAGEVSTDATPSMPETVTVTVTVPAAAGQPEASGGARLETTKDSSWGKLAGKKGTPPAPQDHRHETLRHTGRQSVAGGVITGLSHSLKPKRRLNRDYSQPGKFRGVRYRGKGRYSAELKVKEVRRWLGIFATAEEAARAFDKAAFEVRGKEARFPELIEGAEAHGHHTEEDESNDDEEAALTPGGGAQSCTPRAMAGKRGEGRDAGNRCFELQCQGSADDVAAGVAADGIPGCWEPHQRHDGLTATVCEGSELEGAGEGARGMEQYHDAYGRKVDSMDVDGGEGNATSAAGTCHSSRITLHHTLSSRHPQAESNTLAYSDSRKVIGTSSHMVMCASPSLLPPLAVTRHEHTIRHTHPPRSRPSSSYLLADPLTLPPSLLTLPQAEPDGSSKHSLADRPSPQHPSAASETQALAQMILTQQLQSALAGFSGCDGRPLPGGMSGGPSDGTVVSKEALPTLHVLLKDGCNGGSGTVAETVSSSRSRSKGGGEIAAASDGTTTAVAKTGLRIRCSSADNLHVIHSSDAQQGGNPLASHSR